MDADQSRHLPDMICDDDTNFKDMYVIVFFPDEMPVDNIELFWVVPFTRLKQAENLARDWAKNIIKPVCGAAVTVFHVEDSIPVDTSADPLGLKNCLRCREKPSNKVREGIAVWGPGESLDITLRTFVHFLHLGRWTSHRKQLHNSFVDGRHLPFTSSAAVVKSVQSIDQPRTRPPSQSGRQRHHTATFSNGAKFKGKRCAQRKPVLQITSTGWIQALGSKRLKH
ncbi:hypothetical protein FOCC_FOCC005691 [Frankliniella occidentalis]|uniref:Uncharacterized protein LOC127749304 n=1 Tax=Frankliniella occidentalis TaxID=133901 RepID=A0A9C6U6W6_FRAOC|nr:uncharacterized protein LOC127749304 [Frankliniella occidentalis]KAE8747530.1 hypothetical protein FOCC_FOCC005691 [Frankliniella occidentalis]